MVCPRCSYMYNGHVCTHCGYVKPKGGSMEKSTKYLVNLILGLLVLIGVYHLVDRTTLRNAKLNQQALAYYNAASRCQSQLARILKPAKDKALAEKK